MKRIANLLTAVVFSIAASPAFAADPVFLPGVRVGMVLMEGFMPAKDFVGFETADHGAKILIAELPVAAYTEVDTALKSNPAGLGSVKPEGLDTTAGKAYYTAESAKDGADNVRRYSMIVPGETFSGYVAVQIADNLAKTYSDDSVRQMFATAVVRKEVPLEEQLALMPFKITELSGFKNARTFAPGAAIILADGNEEAGIESAPFMVISLIGSAPESVDDRGRFAQQSATQIPGLRDGHITMSEPVRIDSVPGFETRIDATSGKANTPVTVVQWLRFGAGNSALRIIASAPRDEWTKAFPRFRAVRDGIKGR